MSNFRLREEVLAALKHSEAEEGLYLDNFLYLHEEDERPRVDATELEVLDMLKELIAEGLVDADESQEYVIFRLKR